MYNRKLTHLHIVENFIFYFLNSKQDSYLIPCYMCLWRVRNIQIVSSSTNYFSHWANEYYTSDKKYITRPF